MSKPYNDRDRALAMQRALKFTKLFKEKHFNEIMAAVDGKKFEAFKTACQAAQLQDSEVNWLWNYLQHCDNALVNAVPEADVAAGTGW